jgi:hypothetical protein
MRIVVVCLAAAAWLAGCTTPPQSGPSTTRGLPTLQGGVPPSSGAGGVAPLERPPGSRGGDKGS